jgi:serine/threonine protein kinase
VEKFFRLLNKDVEPAIAAALLQDSKLVSMLRNNTVQQKDIFRIYRGLQNTVTTRSAKSYNLSPLYLFDGLLVVPSKQASTCLQYVVEGSKLRVAKTTTEAEMDPEINALELIHAYHSHCPTIVRPLNCVQSGVGRKSLILPHYGLSLSQLNSTELSKMVSLHANVAMCGLATIMACNNVGLCHGDIKPGNMMLTDSGVVVTIDFGTTVSYGSSSLGESYSFGMDAERVTLKYDLACLASSLLLLVEHDLSNLEMAVVQGTYHDSQTLAERLAAILLSSLDLNSLWSMCTETIQQMVVDPTGLLDYNTLIPK